MTGRRPLWLAGGRSLARSQSVSSAGRVRKARDNLRSCCGRAFGAMEVIEDVIAVSDGIAAEPAALVTTESAARYVKAIFDRELGLTLYGVEVGSSRDDAMRELTNTTATLYSDRVLRELIQNAYDGTLGADDPRIVLRLDEQEGEFGALYVANDGAGFGFDNVDAVTNAALSNKQPGNFIGHKGLGFRSVLLLSDHPEIYSVGGARPGDRFDGFRFRFARPEDERAWLDARRRPEMADGVVGRTHTLQLPVALHDEPDDVTAFAREGFATVIKLPLRDSFALERARNELTALLEEATPLALFLDRLASLIIERVPRDGAVQKRDTSRKPTPCELKDPSGAITLTEVHIDRRRYLHAQMTAPPARFFKAIEEAIAKRHPVEKWREWKGAAIVSIALPLTSDARPGVYYAFLPTTKASPFNGFVDAPFFPNPDRQDIALDNPLNSLLMDVAAELCIRLSELMAQVNDAQPDRCQAAVDALAWHSDPDRLAAAAERLGVSVGGLKLPALRRPTTEVRWARFDEIFDWDDAAWKIIDGARLVRVCDVPMLRRSLGPERTAALAKMFEAVNYVLEAQPEVWAEWAPKLCADLAKKTKTTRRDWEAFYSDLSRMGEVLPHLEGAVIFRTADGAIAQANAKGQETQIFVIADVEGEGVASRHLGRSRRAVMPPGGMAKRMALADPSLSWPRTVVDAFVNAGLVNEYNVPKLLAQSGALLGKKPQKQSVVAALSWAFGLWKDHRSNPADEALKFSGLLTPLASGKIVVASAARFSSGWRDTQGDLVADLCRAGAEVSSGVAGLAASLLPDWEAWPLKDRGTASDWIDFLRLIGVRDGLTEVYHKASAQGPWWWRALKQADGQPTSLERRVGPEWRRELSTVDQGSFGYQSNPYDPEQTLFALPAQADYGDLPDAARLAYAKLIVHRLKDMPATRWKTTLLRRGGNYDKVLFSSPLKAFLNQAAWLPLARGDDIIWAKPRDAWFAPKADPMPRFVRRIEQSVREVIETVPAMRKTLVEVLNLRLWNEASSATARIQALGELLREGINEADHDQFKKEYRDAWHDYFVGDSPRFLGPCLILPVDVVGRLTALPVLKDDNDRPTIFIGDTGGGGLEQLVGALGHPVVTAPTNRSEDVAHALGGAVGGTFRRVDDAGVAVYADGQALTDLRAAPLLITASREWLAEIFVLVLEQAGGFSSRNTPRVRQSLYEDLKKVRVYKSVLLEVEVDGIRGPVPASLQGVIPIPDDQTPAVALTAAPSDLTWGDLTRSAQAIALAIGRSHLKVNFRAAILALAEGRHADPIEPPEDQDVADAMMISVERVRELQRSLRSTNRRLIEWLVPIVHSLYGSDAAHALIVRSDVLFEDHDILRTLASAGVPQAEAEAILKICRDVDSLDSARRCLNIDFAAFNKSLSSLGDGWSPVSFEARLKGQFEARLNERRPALEALVRDAHLRTYDAGEPLSKYLTAKSLAWATFDDRWIEAHDTLDPAIIDGRIDSQARLALPPAVAATLDPVDDLRRHAREVLSLEIEAVRRLVRIWVGRNLVAALPAVWNEPADQIIRACLGSGVFDFRPVLAAELPTFLSRAGLWPAKMPISLSIDDLGIQAADLEDERKKEAQRVLEAQKRRRTIAFGTTDIDGGSESCLTEVSQALDAIVGSQAFWKRSGPAVLRPVPAPDRSGRPSGRRTSGRDPEYMTDEQRSLLGFAGEFAAYHYLRRAAPGFSDEHWVSSLGRRYLGLAPMGDDEGADFHMPRSRIPLFYEVKAHIGDPGYVDLEPTQVARAAEFANDRHGRWRILYVTHVSNPALVAVHELDNPFSTRAQASYRQAKGQGVRFYMDRET